MNVNNKGYESVCLEGSATEIFWIGQRWTSFYWRNMKFSSKRGFQTMWLEGQKGDSALEMRQWTAMLDKSISRVSSPCDSFLSIHCQNHCSNHTAVPEGLWGGESFHRELTWCLVRQSPCPAGTQLWLWKQIPTSLRQTPKSSWVQRHW